MPQGSVLVPLLFLLCNDLEETVLYNVLSDDVALYKEIETSKDCDLLQEGLNNVYF